MTDRYPLPEWPGYTVSVDGVVYNRRGTALSHDTLGRVALRNGSRMGKAHVGKCLQMAGLIHAPHAGENYDAIVARCKAGFRQAVFIWLDCRSGRSVAQGA